MKIVLFSCLLLMSSLAYANEVVDLGTEGGTCSLDFYQSPLFPVALPTAVSGPVYVAPAEKWEGTDGKEARPEILKSFVGKTIFVFGINDAASESAAMKVHPDLAICVRYSKMDEIREFREKTKATYPIQLANDFVVESFKIKSFPVLIKVTEASIEYSSDF